MKTKVLLIGIFCTIFSINNANAQKKSNIDSAFIINNMVKAINQKDLIKVGEELYRMKNGKIQFHPAYIDFFSAMQSIISFQKMDSTSIGPIILIDSAVANFKRASNLSDFKSFEELEIKNPQIGLQYCIDVVNARGKSFFEMKEWIKSLEAYEKGLSINKNYISAIGAGLSSMNKEYFALSQKYFMMAIGLNPQRANSYIMLSEAYIRGKNIDSAITVINGAYNLFKDSLIFLTQAYNVYNIINDTNKCIEVLSELSKMQKNNSEYFFNLGVWYEKKGNLKLSEQNYKLAVNISPETFKYNFNLTVLYFNRYAQLCNDIALKQNLEHYNIEEKKLERIVWIDKAKPFAEKCLMIEPNNIQILNVMYHYYFTNEQAVKANEVLKRIEELKK